MNKLLVVLLASVGLLATRAVAQATYTVTANPTTYSASGGFITFNVTLSYPSGAVPSVGAKPPSAVWAYGGEPTITGMDVPTVKPNLNDTTDPTDPSSVFGFSYITAPATSASFSFIVNYPAGLSGNQIFSFTADYRLSGVRTPVTVAPITIAAGGGGTLAAPVITADPQNVTVFVGQSATFTVTATGNPAPTYQWKKAGTDIPGATGSSYTITSVVTGDAASYHVVATNSQGSTPSNSATLTVNAAPATPLITTQPQSQTVVVGGSVTFSVVATGTGPFSYQWRKETTDISGATGSSYTIASAATADAGSYTVVVTNTAGPTTSNVAILTVAPAPTYSVTANPTTYSASGGQITFNVSLSYPPGAIPSVALKPPAASWTYVSEAGATGHVPTVKPYAGDTTDPADPSSSFGFSYMSPPASPANFSFVLSYPAGLSGNQVLTMTAGYRLDGTLHPVTVPAITLTQGTVQAATISTLAKTPDGTAVPFLFTPPAAGAWAGFTFATGSQPCSITKVSARISGSTTMAPPMGLLFDSTNPSFAANAAIMAFGTPTAVTGTMSTVDFYPAGPVTLAASRTYYFVLSVPVVGTGPIPDHGSYLWARTAVANGADIETGSGWTMPGSYVAKSYTPPPPDGSGAAWTTDSNYRLMAAVYTSAVSGTVPVISSGTSATGAVGMPFTYTITASNSPTSFAATDLPVWLSLNTTTGVITGTPPAAGGYPILLTATNASGTSPAVTLTLNVTAVQGPTITSQPVDQSVLAGSSANFAVSASGSGTLTYQWYYSATSGGTPQALSDLSGKRTGSQTASLAISNVQSADAGYYVCIVTDTAGPTTSQAGMLSIPARLVRIVSQTAGPGTTAVVPVQLVASGNENALGFSLNFDPAQLTFVSAAAGAQATDATLNTNASQATSGKVGFGLAKPAGTLWSAATQEVVKVTFTVGSSVTTGTVCTLTFGDTPVVREISSATAEALAGAYQDGSVTAIAGFEADMNGNGAVTITDWVKVGRIVAGLDARPTGTDFMKADCAPRSSLGGGTLTITDWVQAGRYAAGLDPLTTAGGPTGQ